ncbi:response regulator transcription factor [Sulfoacidibacillus thermotolerans]|uniref:DNA-binding response regulator n=1 Tax=Sulfoacidibacillus thermotolerans TaxID=1765684 RepID=A0A2U3D198_SULT2|nr:response regulator transcription factor [Sulfoacidibacillus thermotolerans]PWI55037.1 DNA-binding response regulator [Sulfoacidibacillus thermotolerans]
MKLLVVEDDKRIASLLQRGLTQLGHTIDLAHDGEDGYYLALNSAYDVIILDVKLPSMDGLTVCQELRKSGIHSAILMLTARDSIDDKVTGLTSGADDYVTKPFSFEELSARIQALFRRPAQYVEQQVLRVHSLELYPQTFEVKKQGVPIELTRKEFSLLELLMRNPNQVLSRELILDRLWGADFEPSANVVDAMIARLRTKLGNGKEKPLIKTIRGVGYKLER